MTRIYESARNQINWKLPPLDEVLNPASKIVVRQNVDQDRARVIEETLASFSAGACGGDSPRPNLHAVRC